MCNTCLLDISMEKRCVICNKPASFRCTNCKRVFYCSSTCQQRHWYSHKQECGILKKDYTSSNKVILFERISFRGKHMILLNILILNKMFLLFHLYNSQESSITITVQIPLRIRKEDIQVDIYENKINIHSINTEFESNVVYFHFCIIMQIELFKPIKQSSTSWSFCKNVNRMIMYSRR